MFSRAIKQTVSTALYTGCLLTPCYVLCIYHTVHTVFINRVEVVKQRLVQLNNAMSSKWDGFHNSVTLVGRLCSQSEQNAIDR